MKKMNGTHENEVSGCEKLGLDIFSVAFPVAISLKSCNNIPFKWVLALALSGNTLFPFLGSGIFALSLFIRPIPCVHPPYPAYPINLVIRHYFLYISFVNQ